MAATKTEIIVPTKIFNPGDLVPFEVKITNLQEFTVYALPNINVAPSPVVETSIVEGTSAAWQFSFIMPEKPITIVAECWAESYNFDWRKDSVARVTLKPEGYSGGLPISLVVVGGALMGLMILSKRRK